jgi:hypothetical protein
MNVPAPLATSNTVLVVIDFQERLFPVMHDKEKLLRNAVKLIKGAKALEMPVIVTEQYPKGLGQTLRKSRLLPEAAREGAFQLLYNEASASRWGLAGRCSSPASSTSACTRRRWAIRAGYEAGGQRLRFCGAG